MDPLNTAQATSDTWPDFVLPGVYLVDLDGLTNEERIAAVTAIEELVRPLRESVVPERNSCDLADRVCVRPLNSKRSSPL
jgi:hypothetical protein